VLLEFDGEGAQGALRPVDVRDPPVRVGRADGGVDRFDLAQARDEAVEPGDRGREGLGLVARVRAPADGRDGVELRCGAAGEQRGDAFQGRGAPVSTGGGSGR
jgi:hypothetical protein